MMDEKRRSFDILAPISLAPMGLLRICVGFLAVLGCLLDWPRLQMFFGPAAFPSIEDEVLLHHSARFSLLFFLPHTELSTTLVWAGALLSAVLLCIGWRSRLSAIVLYVLLTSLYQRNLEVLNSGDTLLRAYVLLLACSDAGKVFSLDAWLDGRRSWQSQWQLQGPSLAQRMIQVQLAAVYCQAALSKLPGSTWQDGTAVYYATHLVEYQKFSIPYIFENLAIVKFLSWASLAIEMALFTLVWFQPWRYFVLSLGLILHLGIDWCMNIPLFEYYMIAGYICFLDADFLRCSLERFGSLITSPWHKNLLPDS